MKFEIITNDLFNIAKRLKKIDKNYLLVRNKEKHRFELWYNSSFMHRELVFKFDKIDARMLDYVNQSRVEFIDKLIKNIDENNEKIKNNQIEKFKNDSLDKIREEIKIW